MALLDINDLKVTFTKGVEHVHAVRGVTLSVTEGESYGIVGESGSGKSTVLRAVCGLAPTTAGTMRIDGKELTQPRRPDFYRNVQMVFQDPYASLHPRHTVDRVLSEPLAIHGFTDREARVEQALEDVGLGVVLHARAVGRARRKDRAPALLRDIAERDPWIHAGDLVFEGAAHGGRPGS